MKDTELLEWVSEYAVQAYITYIPLIRLWASWYRLIYDAQLQPKIAKTASAEAVCGLNIIVAHVHIGHFPNANSRPENCSSTFTGSDTLSVANKNITVTFQMPEVRCLPGLFGRLL